MLRSTIRRAGVLVLGVVMMALGSAAAQAEPDAIQIRETSAGNVLANAAGMTLYIYTRDVPNVSNCYGGCATNWPPAFPTAGVEPEGQYTLVGRTDGTVVWAYKGMPLYLWVQDTAPGDVTGEGRGGVWFVARP